MLHQKLVKDRVPTMQKHPMGPMGQKRLYKKCHEPYLIQTFLTGKRDQTKR